MARSLWQIEHHDFPICDGVGQPRRVTVAIPPVEDVNRRSVVYCTDGQVVETLAAELQRTLPEREQPVLIGVHSHPHARAQEYLLNSSESFLAHERFFAEDVRAWAHATFGVSVAREKSVVFGFSNGGAFAIAAAFRHSDRFVAAIAFSVPPFGNIPALSPSDSSQPFIYLATGNQGSEKSIRKSMLKLLRSLQRQEVSVEYRERACGHTLDFWASEFVAAVHWLNQTAR